MTDYKYLPELSGEPYARGIHIRNGFEPFLVVIFGALIAVPWFILAAHYATSLPAWKWVAFAAAISFVTYQAVWRIVAYYHGAAAWVRYSRLTMFLRVNYPDYRDESIKYMVKHSHAEVMAYLMDPNNTRKILEATEREIIEALNVEKDPEDDNDV